MKIAIITHDFTGFTGSEIVALEIANYFAAKDNQVTIRAERNSEALRPHLHTKVEIAQKRINIVDYDLVWSQHGHFSLNTFDLDRLKNWNGIFISVHLSGYTPAETYHYPFASRYASSCVFNCSKSMEILRNISPPNGKSFNLKNAAPKAFHKPPQKLVKKLRKLLVVSNHVPHELLNALKIADEYGIQIKHLGRAGDYRLINTDDLDNSDAVISIGKTVQYSLCSAKPVYCYDHFGGPGWLMPDNFKEAEHHNFSGRCHQEKKTPNEILLELTEGFEAAERFSTSNWETHSNRYNLDNFMDELLQQTGSNLFNNDKCLEEIDAMRGTLLHVDWIWEDVFSSDIIKENQARIFERDGAISELEKTLSESNSAISELESTLSESNNAISELENALSARDGTISEFEDTLFERDNAIIELENTLTQNLRKPWLPVKDALIRRFAYLAAGLVEPISKRRAMRFSNSASKRNPRRYLSHDENLKNDLNRRL